VDISLRRYNNSSKMGYEKAHELRKLSKDDLLKKLEAAKEDLAQLRVAKVTGGAPSKLGRIRVVRKDIARILTVFNQTRKEKLREKFANAKYLNKDLRARKTRAIRRRLTKDQLYVRVTAQPLTAKSGKASNKYVRRQVPRVAKRLANFPQRVYAVKA